LLDGTYFIGLQAAKKYKEISVDVNQKDLMGIKADVATSYYAILVIDENRKILAESINKLNDTYKQTESIFKEGLIEENDLDQLKLIISTLKTTATSLDRQGELAKKLLKFQLGIDLSEEVTLTDDLAKALADTPTDSPLTTSFKPESNIDYQILRKQNVLADLNYKRIIASYTPSLSGFVSYQWQNFSNSNRIFADQSKYYGISVAGINLRVPIFDGLSTVQRIKSAKLDYKKTEIGLKQMEEGLKLQADQANITYANALDQFKLKKENLDLAKKVKDKALIKYKEGVGSSLEVTTTENQYLQIQADYISSLLNLFNAKIAINKLTNNF
jgi:outer membrane protein TolC